MSNPFDFSDFGAPRAPASPPPAAPVTPGRAAPGAFDPWANQPPSAPPRRRHSGPTDPADAFGAGTTAGDVTGSRDAFGQLGATSATLGALTTAGPPLVWFGVAIALAVAGAVIAGVGVLAGGLILTAVAGWLLAGPAAIGALAVFNRVDTRRRTEAIYSAPTWTTTLYWVVLGSALIGIAIAAWQIALWAGTL